MEQELFLESWLEELRKVVKISIVREKNRRGERRVYVAIKTFMNPCKLVLIVFLRRYGWSLYVYGYLSSSDSINTNLQLC